MVPFPENNNSCSIKMELKVKQLSFGDKRWHFQFVFDGIDTLRLFEFPRSNVISRFGAFQFFFTFRFLKRKVKKQKKQFNFFLNKFFKRELVVVVVVVVDIRLFLVRFNSIVAAATIFCQTDQIRRCQIHLFAFACGSIFSHLHFWFEI